MEPLKNSIENNILTIKNIFLPIGTFTFEIILDIDENTGIGNYENQAVLSGIRLGDLEFNDEVSDDPTTAIPNDATSFSIDALATSFDADFLSICQGGATTLHPGIYGASFYEWSSGETTEAITVDAAGDYQVTVTTQCDQTTGTATVTLDEISLELGSDQTIERGAILSLEPNYTSYSHITSFSWQTTIPQILNCPTCENPTVQPWSDTEVYLMVENGTGCQTDDQFLLKVEDVKIFTPNVFSPNNDNLNDAFYLQGNLSYDITQFQIYDRFGNLIYHRKNGIANQALDGWDGTHNGQECSSGVYLWTAVIAYKNGHQKTLSGDVTLIR